MRKFHYFKFSGDNKRRAGPVNAKKTEQDRERELKSK